MSELSDYKRMVERPMRESYERRISTLTTEIEELRKALVDHNDRLRSCCQVADRDGLDTNWKALRGQIRFTLAEHHEITNAARATLTKAEGDKP